MSNSKRGLTFIGALVLFLVLVCIGVGCSGCGRRLVKYTDPNGYEISYENNLLASEEKAESVLVVTPNGWLIFVGKLTLDNDSFNLWTAYGAVKTEPKKDTAIK